MKTDAFFAEYTSQQAIVKYSRATAGYGISYLLDHDYKKVYVEALKLLPEESKDREIRMLEFGCGAGMNVLQLISVLKREGINVERAIGTDFSSVLIDAAKREAKNFLGQEEFSKVEFYVGSNETLIDDLSASLANEHSRLQNSFDLILGVNTIRYCHRAKKEMDCAKNLFDLLVPGGVCVVIDMNDRFPLFRSALIERLRGRKPDKTECYLPSLEEYTDPFRNAGLEVLRSEHFCWIPHSSGALTCWILRLMSPLLNTVARSRAMRSLVVARKPATLDSGLEAKRVSR